jgi:threonine/homoserine/homoserine lactone efflux protein
VPATLEILAFALLAAASPTVFLATLVVLGTDRGRLNGLLFAAGFILGQAIGLVVPFVVGVAVTSQTEEHGTVTASFELAVGVAMLYGAYRIRRRGTTPLPEESRSARVLARLERVDPKAALAIGIPLGIGTKRLVISILAASTIAVSFSRGVGRANVGAMYVVVASATVWLPVVVYVVVGPRADDWARVSKAWLLANQRLVTFALAVGFGLLFVVDGFVGLAS